MIVVKVPFITKNGEVLTTKDNKEYYVDDTVGFECKFYRNRTDKNVVDKTEFLELVLTENIIFKQETSVINPTIILERTSFPNFNYVYIKELNRYYFINSITSIRNNLWEISLNIDVLMSYKDGIKSLKAFIDRNEYDFNPSIIDTKMVIESGYNITSTEIKTNMFKPYDYYRDDGTLLKTFNGTYAITANGISIQTKE